MSAARRTLPAPAGPVSETHLRAVGVAAAPGGARAAFLEGLREHVLANGDSAGALALIFAEDDDSASLDSVRALVGQGLRALAAALTHELVEMHETDDEGASVTERRAEGLLVLLGTLTAGATHLHERAAKERQGPPAPRRKRSAALEARKAGAR